MPIGPTPPTATRRLAVLIDAENVPASIAPRVIAAAATFGEPRIRRAYGGANALDSWRACLEALAIEPRLVLPCGKNAADIALVIEAMDIMRSGAIDGLCVVSRDSDFTALAVRTREAGILCHGFSHLEPPAALRAACSDFTVLPAPPRVVAAAPVVAPAPPSLVSLIRRALNENPARDGMTIAELGNVLRRLGYVPGSYGPGKLGVVVGRCEEFVVGADRIVRPRPTPRLIAAE